MAAALSQKVEITKDSKPSSELTQNEEEKRLKEELDLLVERILGEDTSLHLLALESLRDMIRSSTTSMTSVPIPLKLLKEHYNSLKEACDRMTVGECQDLCCSIVSVLSMSQEKAEYECLKYCLKSNKSDVGDWGHEYVRQLESEITEQWNGLDADEKIKILQLVKAIIAFDMKHNGEIQACDLLMEIDRLDMLHMDETNYLRVCLYLTNCALYVDEPERSTILNGVIDYYLNFKQYARALVVAMSANNADKMSNIFSKCPDPMIRKQMAYMVGRQQMALELSDDLTDKQELCMIMANLHMNDHFLSLARELDIMEPKTPDEVYKTWLEGLVLRPSYNSDVQVDSAKHNLASSYVNAFVNAGFCRDKLVTGEEGNKWIYKNKQHGMLAATASLGLIHMWDIDGGLTPIDKYLYTGEDYIKSGGLLAIGLVNQGTRADCDPALALLSDYILNDNTIYRIGAIMGLGVAYAGKQHAEATSLLLPVLSDKKSSSEMIGLAAISLGLINVASGNDECIAAILQTLLEMPASELNDNTYARFLPLALGMLQLGRKDATDATMAAVEVLTDPFKNFARITLAMCAYAGSGDVLMIQEFLHTCSETTTPTPQKEDKKETSAITPSERRDGGASTSSGASHSTEKKDEKKDKEKKEVISKQAVATLGVATVAAGEEMGMDMVFRIFGHLGRYGDVSVRRMVPISLALMSVSNPQITVIDVLNKYSHDLDDEVTINAIFALGIVGAGTNNARLATMLRQLAQYHAKNANNLFMVRIAQGLVYMGKGTLTLTPFHTERQIMNPVAFCGLLVTMFCFMDTKTIILGKTHYLLYMLCNAMHPRWLVTLDEELEPLPVTVRVGQAVDVIGKAGTPKTIAGVHTHTTPVLLAVGERAELATDDYEPLSPILEGFVILRKKPATA